MADKEQLIHQIAKKYHVPPSKVRSVVESQFKFLSQKMREDTLPSIRLPFFGVFKVNPNRVKKLNEKSRLKVDRQSKQTSNESEEES